MQTSTEAQRIRQAVHSNSLRMTLVPNQVQIESLRLVDFSRTDGGPSWAAPVTDYIVVSSDDGDVIEKSSVAWDMGYNNLGSHDPVVLPDGSSRACFVSSVAISGTEDLICFYGCNFRSLIPEPYVDDGIYVMKVFDDGDGHLYWGQPITVIKHPRDVVNGTTFFVSFPRIQIINSEYWIIALECSLYAGIETYHLCYFRSKDGVHWTDREYLAGVSTDPDEYNTGINSYVDSYDSFSLGGHSPFEIPDLLDAYLYVDGASTYIVSNGGHGNFVCSSTPLTGYSSPTDLTHRIISRAINLPRSPSVGHTEYRLLDPDNSFISSPLFDAQKEDIVITQKVGYRTVDDSFITHDDLLTLSVEALDEVSHQTELGKRNVSIKTQDFTYRLSSPYYEADMYWEWEGPKQLILDTICDLTSFSVQEGATFITNEKGELTCRNTDANNVTPDALAYFLDGVSHECGILQGMFYVKKSWNNHWVGVAFQGIDERTFLAVKYNGSKFQLVQSVTTKPKRHKIRKYLTPLQQSTTISLSANTWYYFRLQIWHNHVTFHYSTNGTSWTKVIDYQGDEITTKKSYIGLLGKSTAKLGRIHGNVETSGGMQTMSSGSSPLVYAIKITTNDDTGIFKKLSVVAGQAGLPPAATIGLAIDTGGGRPPDLTNDENIVYSQTVPSNVFNYPTLAGTVDVNLQRLVECDPSTDYWLFITFQDSLSGSEDWQAAFQASGSGAYPSGATMVSSNGGSSWSSLSDPTMNLAAYATVDYDNAKVKFKNIRWTSGDVPLSLEHLLTSIVSKPGILNTRYDDMLPANTVGDCIATTDVNLSGVAGIYVRGTNGYKLELDPSTQKVNFYVGGVLNTSIESLVYIPTGIVIHLTVATWLGFHYVFINDCLSAVFFDNSITSEGTVGTDGLGTFSNFRVPDLVGLYDYFVFNDSDTSQSTLEVIIGQTHSKHQPQRVKWFIDYTGAFRALTGNQATVVDTYDSSVDFIKVSTKTKTRKWSISQWIPQGNYYATRWFADILKRVGRRVKHADYASGASDVQAYEDAENVSRDAEEQALTFQMDAVANPTLEREDMIYIKDLPTQTDGSFFISDIDFTYAEVKQSGSGNINPRMSVTLRQVV